MSAAGLATFAHVAGLIAAVWWGCHMRKREGVGGKGARAEAGGWDEEVRKGGGQEGGQKWEQKIKREREREIKQK